MSGVIPPTGPGPGAPKIQGEPAEITPPSRSVEEPQKKSSNYEPVLPPATPKETGKPIVTVVRPSPPGSILYQPKAPPQPHVTSPLVQKHTIGAPPAAPAAQKPPEDPRAVIVAKQEDYLVAHLRQSNMVLQGLHKDPDGLTSFIFGNKRLGVAEANAVMMTLNAAHWSVLRDLRSGALGPEAFKKESFAQVTLQDTHALALRRLETSSIDGDTVKAMTKDPLWRLDPLQKMGDQGLKALNHKDADSFWLWLKNGASSAHVARALTHGPTFQTMAAQAMISAEAPELEGEALLKTAGSLSKGKQLAPNASQIVDVIVELAAIDPVKSRAPAELTQSTTTLEEKLSAVQSVDVGAGLVQEDTPEQQLIRQRKAGKISGFYKNKDGQWETYTLKTVREIAGEVLQKIDAGQLNNLSVETLQQIRQELQPTDKDGKPLTVDENGKPVGKPGQALERRLNAEDNGRYWRQLCDEAIQIAAVGAVSGGIAGVAGAGAQAVFGVGRAARMAHFLANSASFTTMMAAIDGRAPTLGGFANDALMFAALGGVASRLGKLTAGLHMSKGAAPRALGRGIELVGSTVGPAGVMTLAAAGQEWWNTGVLPTSGEAWAQFKHNLLVVSVLKGVHAGIAAISPSVPGEPRTRQDLARMLWEVRKAGRKTNGTMAEIEKALTADKLPITDPQVLKMLEKLAGQHGEAEALKAKLFDFARRHTPDKLPALEKAFGPEDPATAGQPVGQQTGVKEDKKLQEVKAVAEPQAVMIRELSNLNQRLNLLGDASLPKDVLAANVKGVGPNVVKAYVAQLRDPWASVGPDNVKHMVGVYREVLIKARKANGRPLNQRQVDELWRQTAETDDNFKGQPLDKISQAPTVPTSAGDTVGEQHEQAKKQRQEDVRRHLETRPPGKTPLTKRVQQDSFNLAKGWIESGKIPMTEDAVRTEVKERTAALAKQRGLTVKQQEKLRQDVEAATLDAWRTQLMAGGAFMGVLPAMEGVLSHGRKSHEILWQNIQRAHGKNAPAAFFAYLAHDMSSLWQAKRQAESGIKIDWAALEAMETGGKLPKGAAAKLKTLYDTTTSFAGKNFDEITGNDLSPERLDALWQEAAPVREAVAALPPHVRRQIEADRAQFTPYAGAMGKWIRMQAQAPNNRVALKALEKVFNQYHRERLLMDPEPDPLVRGANGSNADARAAAILGLELEHKKSGYRLAEEGDHVPGNFISHILSDPELRQSLKADLGRPPSELTDREIADWFFKRKPDLGKLEKSTTYDPTSAKVMATRGAALSVAAHVVLNPLVTIGAFSNRILRLHSEAEPARAIKAEVAKMETLLEAHSREIPFTKGGPSPDLRDLDFSDPLVIKTLQQIIGPLTKHVRILQNQLKLLEQAPNLDEVAKKKYIPIIQEEIAKLTHVVRMALRGQRGRE
jgi:hypothetical protein